VPRPWQDRLALARVSAFLVLCGLFGPAACAGHKPPRIGPVPWNEMTAAGRVDRLAREGGIEFRLIRLPGAVLRFVELGPHDGDAGLPAGDAILFVHGLNGALGDFGPVLLRYADQGTRRVVAVDLPGWGGSVSETGDYRVSSYAEALARFIDRVHLAKVHLVCHSLGGQVCAALALGHRDLVRSLTLVSPAGVYRADAYLRGAVSHFGRVNIGRVAAGDPARSLVAGLAGRGDLVRRFVVRDRAAVAMLSSFQENLRERLPELRVPTLVIWGMADPILPMQDGFVIAASVPGAVLHLVEGAGHEPQLTHPELVYEWIEAHHRDH
jgi:pimeloyl-ACP methyl ester carboxylesterase